MVTATWVSPMQFAGTAGHGAAVVIDATPDNGGLGAGPTPMENLLLSLAGCTGMDVVSILRKKRVTLADFRIDVSGERAADHPRIFTSIHLHYTLRGAGLSPESARKAVELSLEKYCSVAGMLKQAATITYDIHIPAETTEIAS
jgi:putative redox protein